MTLFEQRNQQNQNRKRQTQSLPQILRFLLIDLLILCMLQLRCTSFFFQRPLSPSFLIIQRRIQQQKQQQQVFDIRRSMATTGTGTSTNNSTSTSTGTSTSSISIGSNESLSFQNNNNKNNNNKNNNQHNLVVVIAGPTAAGKSDVAAKICASKKGIIVSADSVQAYCGVQIGANKPSQEERNETPHILVDVVTDHTENYNAAEWRNDAILSIQTLLLLSQNQHNNDNNNNDNNDYNDDDYAVEKNIDTTTKLRQENILKEINNARLQKGYSLEEPLLPVVCGGTMMYIQWLVHGRPDAMRPSDDAVRKSNEIMANFQDSNDYNGFVQYVSSFGDIFESRTKLFCGEDWYRLHRTLEVALTVQEETDPIKKSKLIDDLYTGERLGSLESLGYDVRCFFLCPDDRMNHTRVIDERCEQMIMKGLLQETAELSLAGILPEMASRAIGYRQTLDYLNDPSACCPENDKNGFVAYLNEFTTATRRYAKKQMAWFRKDKNFMFIPVRTGVVDKAKRIQEAADWVEKFCNLPRDEFDKELQSEDNISGKCKANNAKQGKQMKVYQFERHHLKEGTKALDEAIAQAIKYGRQMQQQQQQQQQEEETKQQEEEQETRKRKAQL